MWRAIGLGLVLAGLAGTAWADEDAPTDGPAGVAAADASETGWTFETAVGVVSDYRYRGVSISGEQPALQAGVTAAHASGFHAGVFASTIEAYGIGPDGDGAKVELDFTLGWAFSAGGFDFDAAAAAWTYPDGTNVSYVEFPLSASRTVDDTTWSVGFEYAPAQDALGGVDNTYVWVGAEWAPETSVWSVNGWVGYEDGAWAPQGKLDWAFGVTRAFGPVSLGLTYVDTDKSWGSPTVVAELKATW